MKKLNSIQTALFGLGGALMVVGAGCYCFMWQQLIASGVFLIGALLFGIMQCLQAYEGKSLTLRRLKSIMNLADLFFIIAGIVMLDNAMFAGHVNHTYSGPLLLKTFFTDLDTYYNVIYNKWLPLMLIAVVLELYTTHRITSELKKEEQNQQ